jgi:hypothetical protein
MVLFGVSPLYYEVQPDTPKAAKFAEKFAARYMRYLSSTRPRGFDGLAKRICPRNKKRPPERIPGAVPF